MKVKAWFVRWQEFWGWLPGIILLAIVGWLALGGISDRNDLIRWMLELPVLCAYAFAAQAFVFLATRRRRPRQTAEEKSDFRTRLLAGEKGALNIYWGDTLAWIVAFVMSLLFFWPAR